MNIKSGRRAVVKAFLDFRNRYGILGIAAVVAVMFKILLFYNLVGVNSYFPAVWLITCLFTYLLFASFHKNKWVPAAVFALISILMFSDVTYCSFFNRYLSVNMLGAAGVLGDITESIKAVMRPVNFLLLADALLVFAAIFKSPLRKEFKAMKTT
ncbi:MAG: hypothetical protein RR361_08235, partial [Anaerovorax sp.]